MNKLPDCPICGRKAVLHNVLLHGEYDMGYTVGCPAYKKNDGIHDVQMCWSGVFSKAWAIEKWEGVVKEYEKV